MTIRRSFSGSVFRALTWPARVVQARRDFAALAMLGERELRDIGLSLQDLRDATALPMSENATHMLARRAEERAALALARRPRKTATPPAGKRELSPAMAGDWRRGLVARVGEKGGANP